MLAAADLGGHNNKISEGFAPAAGPFCDQSTVELHDWQDLQNWQDWKTCCCITKWNAMLGLKCVLC